MLLPGHLQAVLHAGTNLLAVQAMNDTYESPDFLFNCELAGVLNATNSTRLILAGLQPDDAGIYTVMVTNPSGTATSDGAGINLFPFITTHLPAQGMARALTRERAGRTLPFELRPLRVGF